MDRWTNGLMNRWVGRQMNGWKDQLMSGQLGVPTARTLLLPLIMMIYTPVIY